MFVEEGRTAFVFAVVVVDFNGIAGHSSNGNYFIEQILATKNKQKESAKTKIDIPKNIQPSNMKIIVKI